MTDAITELRIVAFQEGEGWVAQCVEYDICVQGKDIAQARRRMAVALREEARYTKEHNGEEFAGIDPAPDYFAAMYESAEEKLAASLDIRIAA